VEHPQERAERVLGRHRTAYRNADGENAERITGYALRCGGEVRLAPFRFALDLFLPEPATRTPGSAPDDRERSGYVLSGKNPLRAPLLAGTLDAWPAPLPCSDPDDCAALHVQNGRLGFRNHAGAISILGNYTGSLFSMGLGLEFLYPLAVRDTARMNPVGGIKRKDGEYFYEITADASVHMNERGALRLQYSRLYRGGGADGRTLMGEGFYVSIEYAL